MGHIQEWFHAEVLGIQCDPAAVAFKQIIVRPHIVGDLRWARGSYDSIRGRISVDWLLEKNQLTLKVTVPANTKATVHVPTSDVANILESGPSHPRSRRRRARRCDAWYCEIPRRIGTLRFHVSFEITKNPITSR